MGASCVAAERGGPLIGPVVVALEVGEQTPGAGSDRAEQRLRQPIGEQLETVELTLRFFGPADTEEVVHAPVMTLSDELLMFPGLRCELVAEREALINVRNVEQRDVASEQDGGQQLGVPEAPRHLDRLACHLMGEGALVRKGEVDGESREQERALGPVLWPERG
jgi:hypothetical protein